MINIKTGKNGKIKGKKGNQRGGRNESDDLAHVSYGGQPNSNGRVSMVGTDIEIKDINVSYVVSTANEADSKSGGVSTFPINTLKNTSHQNTTNQNTNENSRRNSVNNLTQPAVMVDVKDKTGGKDEPLISKNDDEDFMKIEELGYQMREVDNDLDYIADPEDEPIDSCLTLSKSKSRLRERSRSRTP